MLSTFSLLKLSSTDMLKWFGCVFLMPVFFYEQLVELIGNQPHVLDIGSLPFILRLIQERCAYINTAVAIFFMCIRASK